MDIFKGALTSADERLLSSPSRDDLDKMLSLVLVKPVENNFSPMDILPLEKMPHFLNFDLVLDTAPDTFDKFGSATGNPLVESGIASLLRLLLYYAISFPNCSLSVFSKEDIDQILGTTKSEVQDEASYVLGDVIEEKAPEGTPSRPMMEDQALRERLRPRALPLLRRRLLTLLRERPRLWCDLQLMYFPLPFENISKLLSFLFICKHTLFLFHFSSFAMLPVMHVSYNITGL
ncbi:UNVERIFIED_CONTAM: hypothetical protein Sangu_2442100 [Sesamum angustifolium]|uniref:Uncharacterized protein n=1 Tax=Sesamum angustifolium TaxID=2727405 RepID=A0AAW2KWL4_9LAMI